MLLSRKDKKFIDNIIKASIEKALLSTCPEASYQDFSDLAEQATKKICLMLIQYKEASK